MEWSCAGTARRKSPWAWRPPIPGRRGRVCHPTRRTARLVARGFPGPRPAPGIAAPCLRLLSEFLECFAVTLVRGALRRLELLASLGLFGRRDDEPVSVRAEVERRVGIDSQQVENRPVDH